MSKADFIEREYCPGCKSSKRRELYVCGFAESPVKDYLESFYAAQGKIQFEYIYGQDFILDECLVCGMAYQRKFGNEFLMEKLYDEWIDPQYDYINRQKQRDINYYTELSQEMMTIIAYFNTFPSKLKFFDFGTGWGNWPRMAQSFGCEAYGCELSKTRSDYAKSHGIKMISWHEIPDYEFDFINAENVFEHIPEPFETLNHLKRALRTDGLIKINVPNGNDIKRRLNIMDWTAPRGTKNSLNLVSPLEHLNCFTHNSIIIMAEAAGFERVNIKLTYQYIYNTNWKLIKPMIKNLLRPLYRNFCKNTRLFFRQRKN